MTTLILSVVLIPTYREAVGDIEEEVQSAIDEEILGLSHIYEEQGLQALMSAVDARTENSEDRDALYLLTDNSGKHLAGSSMTWPAEVPLVDDSWFTVPEADGDTLEGKVFLFDENERLLVARRSPLKGFRDRLSGRLLLACFLAIAGSGWLAAWVLGRYRRRLALIQSKARDILSGNLSQRLQANGSGDELDELISEFNQAFAEIEKLMEATRHVSSAIAHDMRRPIAALRYRLETLSRHAELPSSVQQDINVLLDQTDQSLNTFSALLRLARLESGSYGPKKEPVDLHHLLQELVDTYAPVAAAEHMEFTAQLTNATVLGDGNLLFLGLQNLIDNAINYGEQRIQVTLSVQDELARIEVRDYGPGVAPAALPHLFERFYRADSARTEGGSGIGLALVRAIVDVHGGQVVASNAHPGLSMVITLPLARDS
ncbi:MAG: HAMP domain-containing sensor histidine kinase [Steroidobacteraceae bacterium]